MKLPRRTFLHLAAGAATLSAMPRFAWAQTYPARPVRLIVGFPPASAADINARLVGQSLSERLGQPFVVENRPGAGSNIGTEVVVRAPPDGYTLLELTTVNTINATLYSNLSFDIVRDIAPVASIGGFPFVMVVNPSFPAKSVPEFIAYAKANPGKINMASPGNGSGPHLAGELFKAMTGVNIVHVPYRGSYFPDLLGGQVQLAFSTIPASIGYIRASTLRPLAVTSATRMDALPDIPILGQFVPDYVAIAWTGIGAPKNTPTEVIDKLNRENNAALADSNMRLRLADLGIAPMPMSPGDFGKFIAEEAEKWAKAVKFSGAKPD
jgi:tripartite-type tricarboxylate transporter receptor subunit TctC